MISRGRIVLRTAQKKLMSRGLWTRVRLCPCCGKFVVKLRLPDAKWKFQLCFFKGWDGNPWYLQTRPERYGLGGGSGNAQRHRKKIKRGPQENPAGPRVEKEPEDPFFSFG